MSNNKDNNQAQVIYDGSYKGYKGGQLGQFRVEDYKGVCRITFTYFGKEQSIIIGRRMLKHFIAELNNKLDFIRFQNKLDFIRFQIKKGARQ